MTLTRIQLEKILLKRAAKRMIFVGMDGTTQDGTNSDLNDPISYALQRTGIQPADITNVMDTDLEDVNDVLKIIELAELRLLENILGNMDMVDVTDGPRTERLSQFAADLKDVITRKQARIEKEYGIGISSLTGGVINLDFQARHDEC